MLYSKSMVNLIMKDSDEQVMIKGSKSANCHRYLVPFRVPKNFLCGFKYESKKRKGYL